MTVFGKWNRAARYMSALAEDYTARRTEEQKGVHQTLLLRSLLLLKSHAPETEEFFAPMLMELMRSVKRPDKKGDRENGAGLHYYCAVKLSGKPMKPVSGYFRGGKGEFRSARTMLEEDYTMALTMYCAGLVGRSADYLGRAVHMLSDICCPPHAAGMTYFSRRRALHKAYERFAAALYPEFLPEEDDSPLEELFSVRTSFTKAINQIASGTDKELSAMLADPFAEVCGRLAFTERAVAALLLRFFQDSSMAPGEAHYAVGAQEFRILPDSQPLSVKITAEGIMLHGVNPSPTSKVSVTKLMLNAAHRRDGLFTLSPADDEKGRVLEVSGGKIRLRPYDPVHSEQLFRL